jgi:large subunit ribosomal protein L49
MGRTKGWRIVRKAAEEFIGFTPPPVSTKLKAHPEVLLKIDLMTQPLPPLKYKLQELPENEAFPAPLGGTENLPFMIERTHLGNLPVYSEYRNNRSKKVTIIRKLYGDSGEFSEELSKVVSNAVIEERNGRIEVKGIHTKNIKTWLLRLGF